MSTESLESTEVAAAARPGWSLVGKKKEKEPSVTDRGKRLLAMMDPVAPATPDAALPPVPVAEVDPAAAMPAAAAAILPPSLVPVAASQPTAEVEIPAVPSDIPVPPVAEVVTDVAPVGGPPPVPAEVLAAMEATSPVAVTTSDSYSGGCGCGRSSGRYSSRTAGSASDPNRSAHIGLSPASSLRGYDIRGARAGCTPGR